MRISASTLLATQQSLSAAKTPVPAFAPTLDKSAGFAPLPLKQAVPEKAPPPPTGPARLGSALDIKV